MPLRFSFSLIKHDSGAPESQVLDRKLCDLSRRHFVPKGGRTLLLIFYGCFPSSGEMDGRLEIQFQVMKFSGKKDLNGNALSDKLFLFPLSLEDLGGFVE